MCRAARDAGSVRDVLERAIAAISIEHVVAAGKAGRSARHRQALVAAEARVGHRRRLEIEVDVVGDEQVEATIAVVVEERAARAPRGAVCIRPARAVVSSNVPPARLRNNRFWPQ